MKLKIDKHVQHHHNRLWFTADTHLGHDNILKYCNRPFKTINDMDDTIIGNLNGFVGKKDILFFLGDFCFHNRHRDECSPVELAAYYRSKIACETIYFICGNHDRKLQKSEDFKKLWTGMYDKLEIQVDGQDIVLCHYAMRTWRKSHHGAWHLYGHSHGDLPDYGFSFDCGVDCNKFLPFSYTTVEYKMKLKKSQGVSNTPHHK